MKTMEKGIAFSRKGDLIRGTFDGKYTVIRNDPNETAEQITARLRRKFALGHCEPIPTGGYPEPVEMRVV